VVHRSARLSRLFFVIALAFSLAFSFSFFGCWG
jgi:hypothetical protein